MAKKKKSPQKIDDDQMVKELFGVTNFKPLEAVNLEGKLLILRPSLLSPKYRLPALLTWRATGGFGCNPKAMGRAIFSRCVGDNEEARWDRSDFIAEYIGDESELRIETPT